MFRDLIFFLFWRLYRSHFIAPTALSYSDNQVFFWVTLLLKVILTGYFFPFLIWRVGDKVYDWKMILSGGLSNECLKVSRSRQRDERFFIFIGQQCWISRATDNQIFRCCSNNSLDRDNFYHWKRVWMILWGGIVEWMLESFDGTCPRISSWPSVSCPRERRRNVFTVGIKRFATFSTHLLRKSISFRFENLKKSERYAYPFFFRGERKWNDFSSKDDWGRLGRSETIILFEWRWFLVQPRGV